jgi:glycerol-3-phosphate dehydrogenase
MDGFENQYLKNGEWMETGGSNLSQTLANLRETVARLARLDFDRAQTLADKFERPEIRIMVHLDMVEVVLGGALTRRLGGWRNQVIVDE